MGKETARAIERISVSMISFVELKRELPRSCRAFDVLKCELRGTRPLRLRVPDRGHQSVDRKTRRGFVDAPGQRTAIG